MNLYDMMLGAKAPNYDTYGLLRAAHVCVDLLTLVS